MAKYEIRLPDRQFAAVPISSVEGKTYLGAIAAAANFAWCNLQIIMRLAREYINCGPRHRPERTWLLADLRRVSQHREIRGAYRRWRKTAPMREWQRSHARLCSGSSCAADGVRELRQPVIIPGDMGRYSFVMLGRETAMRETFGSSCHGAGRVMSRGKATRQARGRDLKAELAEQGVTVRARSRAGIAEEMPRGVQRYRRGGRSDGRSGSHADRRVRLKPFAVIKG